MCGTWTSHVYCKFIIVTLQLWDMSWWWEGVRRGRWSKEMSDMLIRWKVKGLHLSSLVPHFTGYSISFVIFTIDAFEYTTLLSATQLLMITRERKARREGKKKFFFAESRAIWLLLACWDIWSNLIRDGSRRSDCYCCAHKKKTKITYLLCEKEREEETWTLDAMRDERFGQTRFEFIICIGLFIFFRKQRSIIERVTND